MDEWIDAICNICGKQYSATIVDGRVFPPFVCRDCAEDLIYHAEYLEELENRKVLNDE